MLQLLFRLYRAQAPYNEYPQLLGLLLKLLNGELAWSTRREVLKVLGIMGALDPHVHKRNQQSLQGPLGDGTRTTNDAGLHIQSSDELPMDLWPSFATSEAYFSTVAINYLVRILRDPSLSSYHQKVVGSLMLIFKSMGLGCVPYLPKVLPDFFYTIRTCEDTLKEFITWKLGTLVSIVPQNYGHHSVSQQLIVLFMDPWRYLPIILQCCIQVLSDAERCNDYTYVRDILRTLEVFGGTLDGHMHLLLPSLIRLFKVDAFVDIRRAPIKTLIRLIPHVQVNDARLRAAREASQRSSKEDWAEWMRNFSLELLKESPSPALRTCARLAQLQPFVGRDLFTAGFVSYWSQIHESRQLL
ncbi:unnamed protein product [Lactuca virosa]|uniref:Serine/threonine-protein kinase TOR n=1 Tax=Lactuca virosa TaxID=75947 RepID=A0AAU9LZP1_9ASTR|nr:unnamed protein product [Lactuca virosa]